MTAIFKRELKSYLTSMVGYLFIFFVLVLTGIYFSAYQLSGGYSKFETTLSALTFVFLIGVPILSMRVLAEERKQKTDQLLLTAPVSVWDIVFGKYLALVAVFAIPVVIMCVYPLIMSKFGTISYASAYTGILGFFLLGCANLAIGVFMSALTESQVIAAVLTFVFLFAFYMMNGISSFFSQTSMSTAVAFGLLIVALVLWMFLDWMEAGCAHREKGRHWLIDRVFSRDAWKSRNLENALFAGMLMGMTSFWNGAAVIGGLLILMGFAVFSDAKLDYLILAVTAVIFSVLQTKIFIWGNAVSPSFYWGFLSEDKTLTGVLWYLIQMSGIFFAGAVVLVILLKKRQQKAALVSFLFPTAFAFCASLTPDIAVNHKYIMISYAFTAIFWAWAVVQLFLKKISHRVAAVCLVVCLTVTGIYDFVVILRNNGPGHRVSVNMKSDLTDWLEDNLTHDDLILTPEYSINEVTMAGVMMYMGWPYYAWSAGYDTYYRAAKAKVIYSSADMEEIRNLVKQEKITYVLFEEGMEYETMACREDTIASAFKLVYETEDRRIRIYET